MISQNEPSFCSIVSLKKLRNKVCLRYIIIKMRSQKGIGGFLRKRQEIRNQAEKNKEKKGRRLTRKLKRL